MGEGYLKNPFVFKDGFVELPAEDAIANKIDHDWKNPESYLQDDDSVVDW